jgi:hypothetical protein
MACTTACMLCPRDVYVYRVNEGRVCKHTVQHSSSSANETAMNSIAVQPVTAQLVTAAVGAPKTAEQL